MKPVFSMLTVVGVSTAPSHSHFYLAIVSVCKQGKFCKAHHMLQQGIPWINSKIINFADLELQYVHLPATEEAPTATRFSFKQTVRPGGFDTHNEYTIDGVKRTDTVPIFGEISMHACYVVAGVVTRGQTLGHDIESLDDQHAAIVEVVDGENMGWTTTTVWGFEVIDGERRVCKYNITEKGEETATARIVLDYLGLPAL